MAANSRHHGHNGNAGHNGNGHKTRVEQKTTRATGRQKHEISARLEQSHTPAPEQPVGVGHEVQRLSFDVPRDPYVDIGDEIDLWI